MKEIKFSVVDGSNLCPWEERTEFGLVVGGIMSVELGLRFRGYPHTK